jgi:hypothetical protein
VQPRIVGFIWGRSGTLIEKTKDDINYHAEVNMIVELITKAALVELRRHAKLLRREENDRFLNTTMRDVTNMLRADISAARTGFVQSRNMRPEFEPKGGRLLPALPSGENVGPYEDEIGVRLVLFARAAATPVLANYGYKPPKCFEESVRHSAKVRACRLHFYRLIAGYFAIEVESSATPSELDTSFLKKLGIRPNTEI